MNANDLWAAGYKKFQDNFKHAMCGWQKRIRNDEGKTLFFINIYQYDMSQFKSRGYTGEDYNFEVDNQYYRDIMPDTINICFSCTNLTLDETEKFCHDIFYKLYCVNDRYND